jgi:hypothetical protein
MSIIRGYMVRLYDAEGNINNEKLFHSDDLLESRRQAFRYAENLADVLEEAKVAGVINCVGFEEMIHPDMKTEYLSRCNVHVSILYELIGEFEKRKTREDQIYFPKTLEFDLTDKTAIEIFKREAEFYTRTGKSNVRIITIENKTIYLLMDDYTRLKSKGLIDNYMDRL